MTEVVSFDEASEYVDTQALTVLMNEMIQIDPKIQFEFDTRNIDGYYPTNTSLDITGWDTRHHGYAYIIVNRIRAKTRKYRAFDGFAVEFIDGEPDSTDEKYWDDPAKIRDGWLKEYEDEFKAKFARLLTKYKFKFSINDP